MSSNYCMDCGACCAAFRVDFHPYDLASTDKTGVAPELTIRLTPNLCRMKGTDDASPRCIALKGEIGQAVSCSIYENRPGPCREFMPLAPFGIADEACDRARKKHGLPPLDE